MHLHLLKFTIGVFALFTDISADKTPKSLFLTRAIPLTVFLYPASLAGAVSELALYSSWPELLSSVATTGRQLPPLSSVLYGIISGRRSVLAA
jgi:hypothetical protein